MSCVPVGGGADRNTGQCPVFRSCSGRRGTETQDSVLCSGRVRVGGDRNTGQCPVFRSCSVVAGASFEASSFEASSFEVASVEAVRERLKDPARRGMILPRPRVHRTGLDDFHFKLRADGPLQPPQTPKLCRYIRFVRISGFTRSPPKTQGPKGVQSRMYRRSFWGFGATGNLQKRPSL